MGGDGVVSRGQILFRVGMQYKRPRLYTSWLLISWPYRLLYVIIILVLVNHPVLISDLGGIKDFEGA